jgi:hypothetical protein
MCSASITPPAGTTIVSLNLYALFSGNMTVTAPSGAVQTYAASVATYPQILVPMSGSGTVLVNLSIATTTTNAQFMMSYFAQSASCTSAVGGGSRFGGGAV